MLDLASTVARHAGPARSSHPGRVTNTSKAGACSGCRSTPDTCWRCGSFPRTTSRPTEPSGIAIPKAAGRSTWTDHGSTPPAPATTARPAAHVDHAHIDHRLDRDQRPCGSRWTRRTSSGRSRPRRRRCCVCSMPPSPRMPLWTWRAHWSRASPRAAGTTNTRLGDIRMSATMPSGHVGILMPAPHVRDRRVHRGPRRQGLSVDRRGSAPTRRSAAFRSRPVGCSRSAAHGRSSTTPSTSEPEPRPPYNENSSDRDSAPAASTTTGSPDSAPIGSPELCGAGRLMSDDERCRRVVCGRTARTGRSALAAATATTRPARNPRASAGYRRHLRHASGLPRRGARQPRGMSASTSSAASASSSACRPMPDHDPPEGRSRTECCGVGSCSVHGVPIQRAE